MDLFSYQWKCLRLAKASPGFVRGGGRMMHYLDHTLGLSLDKPTYSLLLVSIVLKVFQTSKLKTHQSEDLGKSVYD